MAKRSSIIQLKGIVQEYDWGKDSTSIISANFGYKSASGKFAELWFGTHPKAPAIISQTSKNLLEEIETYPQILGTKVLEKFGKNLPFLFKLLSVSEALSIQAHPDGERAPLLHAKDPRNYPDKFPKPEVGIAISPVKLLYGFRPLTEITNFLNPEHKDFVPEYQEILKKLADLSYQKIYQELVTADPNLVKQASKSLILRLTQKEVPSELELEIIKLKKQYPDGDLGVFCFYLLNFITVQPGEALYIDSNIPHAYLKGELLECMAPSDNVVRGGLTNKYIDQETLLSMLDFQEHQAKILTITGKSDLNFYQTPDNGFFKIGKFAKTVDQLFATDGNPQLLFCLSGEASILIDYEVYPIPPGQAVLVPADLKDFQIKTNEADLFLVTYH